MGLVRPLCGPLAPQIRRVIPLLGSQHFFGLQEIGESQQQRPPLSVLGLSPRPVGNPKKSLLDGYHVRIALHSQCYGPRPDALGWGTIIPCLEFNIRRSCSRRENTLHSVLNVAFQENKGCLCQSHAAHDIADFPAHRSYDPALEYQYKVRDCDQSSRSAGISPIWMNLGNMRHSRSPWR